MKKFIFIFTFLSIYFSSKAQFIFGGGGGLKHTSSANDGTDYSKSQFWLGIKGGVNLSWATVGDKYQIYQPTPSGVTTNYEKTYDGIQFPGFQSGIQLIYNFRSYFSVVFEPSYSVQSFAYRNNFNWTSTAPESSVRLEQKNTYSFQYLDFPLYLRIDLFKGNARPYITGGMIYSYLTRAGRKSEYTSSDGITGAQNILDNPVPDINVTNLFIHSNFWSAFGAGFSYDIKNIRVGITALYKASLNNSTSEANRFSIQKINSTGDVLDNVKLKNIEISLYCVFPMKFITSPSFRRVNP